MVVIFFRLEIAKFLNPYLKYSHLIVTVFLISLSYLIIVNDSYVDTFILVVEHNIQLLKHSVNQFFNHVFFHHYIVEFSDYIFRGLILGYLIFYPYKYKKKFPSSVYKAQNNYVNMFYIFFIVLFCLFCGRFGI
jgi:hypothetical protein